jgi:bacterioferritin
MNHVNLDAKTSSVVVGTLNRILELELAGLVRYLHYSFMIFGHNRIPIVAWLREQANEAQTHATLAGEHITNLDGLVAGKSVMLEEYARDQIAAEDAHLAEIRKMMRKPGSIK